MIHAEPLLYTWAQSYGKEIVTFPIEYLDVPKLNAGSESDNLKSYLLEQIHTIKRRKISNHIRYDSIYRELGLTDPDKAKRHLIKQKVVRCLDYWKEIGVILDYNADLRHDPQKLVPDLQVYAIEITVEQPSVKKKLSTKSSKD